MTESIERYANKFPNEISRAIDGLEGETRRAVFVLLYDEERLAFAEIKEELSDEEEELHQQTLTNALNDLISGGLVEKRVLEADEETRFSSYYSVTEYGNRFLNSLFDSLGDVRGSKGRRRPMIEMSGGLYESGMEMGGEISEALR